MTAIPKLKLSETAYEVLKETANEYGLDAEDLLSFIIEGLSQEELWAFASEFLGEMEEEDSSEEEE